MSQGSLRRPAEEAGFDQRDGSASNQLRSSPPEARASGDDETFNRWFIKGCRVPTRSTEAGDRSDASHAWPPPTAPSKPLLHERIRGKPRAYTLDMPVQEKRRFIKQPAPRQRDRGEWDPRQGRIHEGAGSRAARRHTITKPLPI
jgi:hypothetical protein